MTNTFIIIVTLVFLLLGVIWKTNDVMNVVFKVLFYTLTFWGGYIIFTSKLIG